MKASLMLLIFLGLGSATFAQSAQLSGRVLFHDAPVPFANVALMGTTHGAATDEAGYFTIGGVPEGSYTLVVSSMGYDAIKRQVQVQDGSPLALGTFMLEENSLGLNEVVVTGTLTETYLTQSPVKVEVIPATFLQRNIAPTNLMEALTVVNGVQEVTACGVCFTNQISINGLPGPYTAVLMDGTPIYGNLASVYGLNGIPIQIIDRFEVIKGPNSTLYGSEAVAGVINIITKDPTQQPLLNVDLMGTSHREAFGNVAVAPRVGKWSGYVGLNWAYLQDFEDFNEDQFSDNVHLDRYSLFTKWARKRPEGKRATVAAKYYYEDRRNGVEEFLTDRAYRTLRGSAEVYGESIYTHRVEVFGTFDLPTEAPITLDYSASYHDQDSYYGDVGYVAQQSIGFINATWRPTLGKHRLLVGLTSRYQDYDDNTAATTVADRQFIPGVFVQDEWAPSEQWTVLGGLRLDHYGSHGPILAPRLNVKYKPAAYTSIRANFGTGFRIVNLFTEDHAFVTGQREVEITEALNPERSLNGSLNFNQVYTLGAGQGMLDVDAFYTHFFNKITPNYDEPGKIVYANTEGYAVSRGLGLSVNHDFGFPLTVNMSANVMQVLQVEPNESGVLEAAPVEFAPQWSGVSTVNYELKRWGLLLAYTLRITGPMALPEVYDLDAEGNPLPQPRAQVSEPFAFQNLQLTKTFSDQWSVYLGLANVFNERQDVSPLSAYDDPNFATGFSPYFDTAYAFAPLHGREVYVGVRWNTGRRK